MASKYKEMEVKKGTTFEVAMPKPPEQAPSFFKWQIKFEGGPVEISEDGRSLKVKADVLGTHSLSFVPATTEGYVLMIGQYTNWGDDNKIIVTVRSSTPK